MAASSEQSLQDDNSYQTVIIIVLAMVLTNSAVLLRLLARRTMSLQLMADDYMIILAAFFVNGDAIVYPFSIRYGDGRHIETLSSQDLVGYFKTIYVSSQLYGCSITAVKLSVLLFYRRVFSTAPFRRPLIFLSVLVLVWFLVNNILGAFQCTPVRKAWDPQVPGRCINYLSFFIGMQVPNVVLDGAILVLPVGAVYQLQMSKKKKISVAAIFLLGGFSVVIAIVRLAVLITRINKTDLTYSTAIGNWSLIEPAVEVVSASLPTMTPFLNVRLQWNKLRSSLRSTFRSPRGVALTDNGHGFHEIPNVDRPDRSNGEGGPVRDVSATSEVGGELAKGREIPMHSIAASKGRLILDGLEPSELSELSELISGDHIEIIYSTRDPMMADQTSYMYAANFDVPPLEPRDAQDLFEQLRKPHPSFAHFRDPSVVGDSGSPEPEVISKLVASVGHLPAAIVNATHYFKDNFAFTNPYALSAFLAEWEGSEAVKGRLLQFRRRTFIYPHTMQASFEVSTSRLKRSVGIDLYTCSLYLLRLLSMVDVNEFARSELESLCALLGRFVSVEKVEHEILRYLSSDTSVAHRCVTELVHVSLLSDPEGRGILLLNDLTKACVWLTVKRDMDETAQSQRVLQQVAKFLIRTWPRTSGTESATAFETPVT